MVVFRDALLASLICPFVIFFILYWDDSILYFRLVDIYLRVYRLSKSNTCIFFTCIKKNDYFTKKSGSS